MTIYPGITPPFQAALAKQGYTNLTSVQQAVLAPELQNSDLLVSAQTGSGKTVAFGLALAPTLLGDKQSFDRTGVPLALVIAPTRELALQVTRELEWLYAPSGGTVISCVGGMDMRTERQALARGAHIVVGTPGRLKDHIERGSFDSSQLKAVVLDEADEMLDMGFRDELQYILDTSPKERRTLMFSATMAKGIVAMAKAYQRNAQRITTKEEEKQHADIEYQALSIAPSDRENAIINLLRYHDAKSAIIFCGTRIEVNHLTSRLTNRGFSVVALSGELSQAERSHALQALRDGRARVCVATDVASRGIDLPGLALVIHADIPKNRDILLHRSGRTGRAGSKGISALIVPHNARKRAEIMLRNARVSAAWGKPPSIENILARDRERFLANPAFSEPVKDDEKPAIAELLSRYQPDQVAAALIRLHNAQKPAPEELLDAAPASSHGKASRDDFKNSVWISLSVGQDMSAEPRWILPMLCGRGNITKRNIGSIKIQQNETHVELTADCIEGFFKAVGAGGKIEKNIVVTRLQGAPGPQTAHATPHKEKKKHSDFKPRHEKPAEAAKPKYQPKKIGEKPKFHGTKPGEGKNKRKFRDK
jgi:ATP-dependent RNA helicase DeaD